MPDTAARNAGIEAAADLADLMSVGSKLNEGERYLLGRCAEKIRELKAAT